MVGLSVTAVSPATTAKPIEIKFGLRTLVGPRTPTTVLRPFFRDHPGEPVPAENFWTLWCKGRLTEADTQVRLGATPSGLTSAYLHHRPIFFYRPDGVAPSRMVCVSASVNLPLHHKVQKFSSGTGSPGWSQKKGRKTVVVWWWWLYFYLWNKQSQRFQTWCIHYR